MSGALTLLTTLLVAAPGSAQVGGAAAAPTPEQVDALVAGGRLQEAAWAARAAGDTARGDSILERLEAILHSPPVSARPLGLDSQGVSYTLRFRHEGGVASLFKVDSSDIFCRACGASREVAVYRIDRLLGVDLTPMTVFQRVVQNGDTLKGSAMYFVEGASRPSEVGRHKPDRLRFFDAVIGNSDRHGGNWLVRESGAAVAIDHNRAFEYQPSSRPKTCWETEVDSIAAPGALGPPYARYRALPDDSLRAAVAGVLEPALVETFVAMRDRIVDRIERRIRRPRRALPREDCPWDT